MQFGAVRLVSAVVRNAMTHAQGETFYGTSNSSKYSTYLAFLCQFDCIKPEEPNRFCMEERVFTSFNMLLLPSQPAFEEDTIAQEPAPQPGFETAQHRSAMACISAELNWPDSAQPEIVHVAV
jgi:hypothetical protein